MGVKNQDHEMVLVLARSQIHSGTATVRVNSLIPETAVSICGIDGG